MGSLLWRVLPHFIWTRLWIEMLWIKSTNDSTNDPQPRTSLRVLRVLPRERYALSPLEVREVEVVCKDCCLARARPLSRPRKNQQPAAVYVRTRALARVC